MYKELQCRKKQGRVCIIAHVWTLASCFMWSITAHRKLPIRQITIFPAVAISFLCSVISFSRIVDLCHLVPWQPAKHTCLSRQLLANYSITFLLHLSLCSLKLTSVSPPTTRPHPLSPSTYLRCSSFCRGFYVPVPFLQTSSLVEPWPFSFSVR